MSFEAILWAMRSAPVADAGEWAVLVVMAESADSDGCNAYQSRKTIGDMPKLDQKTVGLKQAAMEARGVIVRGDQSVVAHIPADRRPVNWDLQIPYEWFPDVAKMNARRVACGRDPLRPSDRPNLSDAPAKKPRKDRGVARPERRKKAGGTSIPVANGGTQSPGGNQSPVTGGLEVTDGGTQSPTTLSITQPINPVLSDELALVPPIVGQIVEAATTQSGSAQSILSDYIDWCQSLQAPVPTRVRGHLAREIKQLLVDGFDVRTVKLALTAWHERGAHPSALASIAQHVNRPQQSTTDRRVTAGLELVQHFARQEGLA